MESTFRICTLTAVILFSLTGSLLSSAVNPSATELRSMVVEKPDSVIELLDKIESDTHSTLPSYEINVLRGLAYNEKRMFSMVQKYAQEALISDSITAHPKEMATALSLLADAQAYFGNYPGSIATSTRLVELSRETGNKPGELHSLMTMAETSFGMGNREKGYSYLEQIIAHEKETDNVRVLANVSAAYGMRVIQLYADDKYGEGLEQGYKRLAVVDKIDALGGAPEGFTDQQRAYAYARIASCAQQLGKRDEAEKAYNSFMSTTYASHPRGRAYIMDYLLDAKKWKTVLEFARPLYPILSKGDTINDDYRSLLTVEARANAGLGNYKEAYMLSNRAAAIQDSLSKRENTVRAQELAAIYALNEHQLELERTNSKLQRRNIIIGAVVGITVFLLIIVVQLLRAYRMKKSQHKIATDRIDELLNMNKLAPVMSDEEEEERSLFITMQQQLVNSDLFTNPSFNRESIVDVTGLSRNKVIRLIDKYVGMTPGEYLNKLRVEHAAMLIQEHPEWSIDAISEASGYVRRATFYNHFSKIFGITPAQYRESKRKEPDPSEGA